MALGTLKKMALKPFSVFFFLLAVFAAVSMLILFIFQQQAALDDLLPPDSAKGSFDAAKVKKYRQVFSILEQRGKNLGQTASSTYSNVFVAPAGLTEPQN